jgi:hypothetical protein
MSKTFNVILTKTTTENSQSITVTAKTEEEAYELALAHASECTYTTVDIGYEVDWLEEEEEEEELEEE